jgi:hypothetical protein
VLEQPSLSIRVTTVYELKAMAAKHKAFASNLRLIAFGSMHAGGR